MNALEERLADELREAAAGVVAAPGLAARAVAEGRRRQRRRAAVALAVTAASVASAAVVATALAPQPTTVPAPATSPTADVSPSPTVSAPTPTEPAPETTPPEDVPFAAELAAIEALPYVDEPPEVVGTVSSRSFTYRGRTYSNPDGWLLTVVGQHADGRLLGVLEDGTPELAAGERWYGWLSEDGTWEGLASEDGDGAQLTGLALHLEAEELVLYGTHEGGRTVVKDADGQVVTELAGHWEVRGFTREGLVVSETGGGSKVLASTLRDPVTVPGAAAPASSASERVLVLSGEDGCVVGTLTEGGLQDEWRCPDHHSSSLSPEGTWLVGHMGGAFRVGTDDGLSLPTGSLTNGAEIVWEDDSTVVISAPEGAATVRCSLPAEGEDRADCVRLRGP